MLTLNEFVSNTISSIQTGLDGSDFQLGYVDHNGHPSNFSGVINFDLEVSDIAEMSGKGEGNIYVVGIGLSGKKEHSVTNRVRFVITKEQNRPSRANLDAIAKKLI